MDDAPPKLGAAEAAEQLDQWWEKQFRLAGVALDDWHAIANWVVAPKLGEWFRAGTPKPKIEAGQPVFELIADLRRLGVSLSAAVTMVLPERGRGRDALKSAYVYWNRRRRRR
jgi:hypothetical protein